VELSEVLALLAGIACVVFYFKSKKQSLEARRAIIDQRNAEANEIHRQAEELRNGLVKKKEDYEKAKLKVFAVVDGDKPESTDDGKE
jgi:hypothetical protein